MLQNHMLLLDRSSDNTDFIFHLTNGSQPKDTFRNFHILNVKYIFMKKNVYTYQGRQGSVTAMYTIPII